MILCLIILLIGIALLVTGVIVCYKHRRDWEPIWAMAMTVIGVFSVVISIILLIVLPIESRKELNMFTSQKEYIENYEPSSEYDTAAIATKKIELNQWLYGAQYTKEHYPICSFYGDEILELEPIK